MTPRATPAATVPLDCGSTATVAMSAMAAAVARTVSFLFIVGRNSLPAPGASCTVVLVLSTQYRCENRHFRGQQLSIPASPISLPQRSSPLRHYRRGPHGDLPDPIAAYIRSSRQTYTTTIYFNPSDGRIPGFRIPQTDPVPEGKNH
jgi:hypothetical protein